MNSNKRSREEDEEPEKEKKPGYKVLKQNVDVETDIAPVHVPSGWSEGQLGFQRAFMMYVKSNNTALLQQCLKSSPYTIIDINCNLHHETLLTPLMFATINGYPALVKVLISDRRIDPNKTDIDGFTALHHALTLGESEIVSQLISMPDVKLDLVDGRGSTVAQLAVESDLAMREFDCTSVLSKCPGVDWTFRDCLGRTLLMIACREDEHELVSILGEIPSLQLNSQDQDGLTAVHHAVMSGSLDCLEALRKVKGGEGKERRRVDWNVSSWLGQGETPLSLAVRGGDPEVVEILLSVPSVRPGLRSLSLLAVESSASRAVEVVDILSRDERVDWEVRDQQGDTPILSALRKKRTDMVRILMRNPRIDLSEVREVARGARTVEGVEAGEVETLLWETLVEVRTRLGQVEDSLPSCPVCYQRLSSPPGQVLQCEEGHLVCAQCGDRPELVHCPVCRGEMAGRAIGVEQFLQDLL